MAPVALGLAGLRSRRRQHGGQCAQVGGERGGERAHKAREGVLLAERRDERRVAPRAARRGRSAANTRPRRASSVGGELFSAAAATRRNAHSSFAGRGASGARQAAAGGGRAPSTTSRANGISSGGGAAPAVRSNVWPSARSRYFSSSSSLRPSSAPSPSSDSSSGSVHNGPSAGAPGAAATTAALRLAAPTGALWQRRSGAALPNPQRRVPKSAASTTRAPRGSGRSAWSCSVPVAPTRLGARRRRLRAQQRQRQQQNLPLSAGVSACACTSVRVGERGVGVVGTAEEGAVVPPQRSRSVRRSSSRRASCARSAARRASPQATAARHPTSAACREFEAARARATRATGAWRCRRRTRAAAPRCAGASAAARAQNRRAAPPSAQPAWRPAILRVEESDYRQCLRAVLCQRGGERQLQKQLASDEIAPGDECVVHRSKRRTGQQIHDW